MFDSAGHELPAIEAIRLSPVGPENIVPRPWAYGHFLMFGEAAVIGAVDGGGKGAIAVTMALAMITGKPLLGEKVWRKGPVAIVTYEDDAIEWHRRIAAACIRHEVDYREALANIHIIVKRLPGAAIPGQTGRVSFGMIVEGMIISDADDVAAVLKSLGVVLLIVDPFNHAHSLDDGNNNVLIARVAQEMTRVAKESYVAVLVLHHLRKGSVGTPDDLMGATSLRATFRSCRILARMTPEVAEKMKITDAWRYIRIAGSKENYAPPPEKSSWFKLEGVRLNNVTEDYPEGDDVGVATTWEPRPMFEGMEHDTLKQVFQALRDTVHNPNKQSKHLPWAGKALMEVGKRSEREAAKIVAQWMENSVLVKGPFYHAASKHTVDRVTLDDEKAAAILFEVRTVGLPPEQPETCG
jgi:hypothetical protein